VSLEAWIAFCITETVLCLTPGPAVLFVVSVAMARGARAGIAGSLGILTANALYFAVSATGVAAIIVASSRLFAVLKWIGAIYLIWVGLRMLWSRSREPLAVSPRRVPRSFVRGFVVQAANPKALMFFVALLPQFIDPDGSVWFQVIVLGASSVLIELIVLTLYVALTVRARRVAGADWSRALERLGGGFLVAAGARLALIRSR
jgi:threonine/homoserine/homoserine lactone efflux protein